MRLRGAAVGAASGAVAVAAHALGGGTAFPEGSALALLLATCALIGVVVATVRPRSGVASTMAMLAVGQGIGHEALSMAPDHHHHGATLPMLVAHLVAIPVGAILIRAAEIGVHRAVTSVRRFIVGLGLVPVPPGPAAQVSTDQSSVALRLLASSGIGRRGPPVVRNLSLLAPA